jgi:hypothetical protein
MAYTIIVCSGDQMIVDGVCVYIYMYVYIVVLPLSFRVVLTYVFTIVQFYISLEKHCGCRIFTCVENELDLLESLKSGSKVIKFHWGCILL